MRNPILIYLQVADFGLNKLIDVGSSSLPTVNMKGTFGYMPPEYDELCFSLLCTHL